MIKRICKLLILTTSLSMLFLVGCGREKLGTTKTETEAVQVENEKGESISSVVDKSIYQCINGSQQIDGIVDWKISESEKGYVLRIDSTTELKDENKQIVEKTIRDNLKNFIKDKELTINFEIKK